MDVYASAVAMGNPKSLYATEDRTDLDIFINEVVQQLKYFFTLDMQSTFESSVRKEFNKIIVRKDISNAQKLAHLKNIVYVQLYPQISKAIRMEMNEQGVLQGDKSQEAQNELTRVVESIIYYNQQEREAKKNLEQQATLGNLPVETRLQMFSETYQQRLREVAEKAAKE